MALQAAKDVTVEAVYGELIAETVHSMVKEFVSEEWSEKKKTQQIEIDISTGDEFSSASLVPTRGQRQVQPKISATIGEKQIPRELTIAIGKEISKPVDCASLWCEKYDGFQRKDWQLPCCVGKKELFFGDSMYKL